METKKIYNELEKAQVDGTIKSLLLIACEESRCRQILMGDKTEAEYGLLSAMVECKDMELLVKKCSRNFGKFKKKYAEN